MSKNNTKQTCNDLIDSHLQSRLEQIEPSFDTLESCVEWYRCRMGYSADTVALCKLIDECLPETAEEVKANSREQKQTMLEYIELYYLKDIKYHLEEKHSDSLHEMVLSVNQYKTYRILLSTGGPEDYIELVWDISNECWDGGRYYYKDWYDGASRRLTRDQIETVADRFAVGPQFE